MVKSQFLPEGIMIYLGKKNNDLIVLPQPGMVAGIGVTIPKQPFSGQWISEINQISDVVWQFNLPEEFQ